MKNLLFVIVLLTAQVMVVAQNKVVVSQASGKTIYNTTKVTSIDIDNDVIKVNHTSGTDTYKGVFRR